MPARGTKVNDVVYNMSGEFIDKVFGRTFRYNWAATVTEYVQVSPRNQI